MQRVTSLTNITLSTHLHKLVTGYMPHHTLSKPTRRGRSPASPDEAAAALTGRTTGVATPPSLYRLVFLPPDPTTSSASSSSRLRITRPYQTQPSTDRVRSLRLTCGFNSLFVSDSSVASHPSVSSGQDVGISYPHNSQASDTGQSPSYAVNQTPLARRRHRRLRLVSIGAFGNPM